MGWGRGGGGEVGTLSAICVNIRLLASRGESRGEVRDGGEFWACGKEMIVRQLCT